MSFVNAFRLNHRLGPKADIALILLAVLGFLLPVLSQVSTYHSDEHYYMDSAVYMLQHHDFLTPHYADGTLRAKKPIITYWALIAGYAVFGINFFAARFVFLLAGCLTVWLTYRISLRLFDSHFGALLAAVILATNVQFLMLCLRATPDILQALFITASLNGFVAIIFNQERRLWNYLFAYCGAALAVETKGLLGAAPVAFAFIFILVSRKKDDRMRELIHLPVMGLALAVALSWYLNLYLQHGDTALGLFLSDQVAEKLEGSKYIILLNLKDYLWGVFRNFFPWSLLVVIAIFVCRRSFQKFLNQHKKKVIFVGCWFGLLLLIFVGGSDCRTRYLIPAYPLLAALMAAFLTVALKAVRFQIIWQWWCHATIALVAILGFGLLFLGAILARELIVAAAVMLVLIGVAKYGKHYNGKIFSPIRIGLILLVAFACIRGLVLPIFEFAPSRSLTACILSEHQGIEDFTVWSMKRYNHTRQIYTLSKGRIRVNYTPRGLSPDSLDGRAPVILTEKEKQALSASQYSVRECGFVFRPPKFKTLWPALVSGQKDRIFELIQEPVYLALIKT